MLEKITELTDEEMEAITLTINLIFSGNFEIIDENLVVIRLFAEALLLRQQCLRTRRGQMLENFLYTAINKHKVIYSELTLGYTSKKTLNLCIER